MPQLEIATYFTQIFWAFVFFLMFLLISSKIILPSVGKTINRRQYLLRSLIQRAGDARSEAVTVSTKSETLINSERSKAREALENILSSLRFELLEKQEQLKRAHTEQISSSFSAVETAAKNALSSIKTDVVVTAILKKFSNGV